MTQTELLKKAIDRSGLKRQYIADQLDISRFTLTKKISGENEFWGSEIKKLSEILSLTGEEINEIFFND